MEWIIEFIESQNYLRVTTKGIFNADDHLRMIEDVLSKPFWKTGMSVLFDSRQLSHRESDFYIIKEASINMAKYDAQIGAGRAAILMGEPESFEKGQQFEVLTEEKVSAEIGIFQDEKKAIFWLNQT